ncbi:MAG: cofactor-independent phosphoglycerate mutase [Prevotella sp.]|nr:cofactor-independent phosphoglycerate mutase [Prevotella sp.]
MKHIIILGDGMADHAVERLGGKTLLQYANTPYMDMLARMGRTGRLITIPDGFQSGSEVANAAILGYDLNEVYEGRGPLEAASIGYEMQPGDFALRCNIINVQNGLIITHNGGNLSTEDAEPLIEYLNEKLSNDPEIVSRFGKNRVRFIKGIQYRHLLVVSNGNKNVDCAPPHDHPNEEWEKLLPVALTPEAQETADLLTMLIVKSQALLAEHPFNKARAERGERQANCVWPWGGGYRPKMQTLMQQFPQVKSGAVISAVDLIRGIGHYAGLRNIIVDGATGLADTNYEGKAAAAIEALRNDDFVYVHVEASDEAGHDGNLELKIRTIENLDSRIVKPVYEAVSQWDEPVCIAVLPDHPTPVEVRTHVSEPVPFLIYYKGIEPDNVTSYDEVSCVSGSYGLLRLQEFMKTLMNI